MVMPLADDVDGRSLTAMATGIADLPATLPPAARERIQELMAYVSSAVEQPVRFLGQAPGASHEGWVLQVGDLPGSKVVVRLEPDEGPFLDYDGAREATLLRQLAVLGFPVPRVLAVADQDLVGARFIVLEWIEGEVLNPRTALDKEPAERQARARAMATMLARLHAAPWRTLVGFESAEEAAAIDETVDDGLDAILQQFGLALSQLRVVNSVVLDFVRVWLERRAPERKPQCGIVHGDFRLGNLVWQGAEIVGILDWETASLGDPLFDIAWMCMGATEGSDQVMGLVSRDEFVQLYAEASGRVIDPADLVFWQVVAAWVRGCTEARLLDISIMSHAPSARDARDLSWEFGSARTDEELFELIGSYERPG
jgi:aminoglycoside phosphotransferase (APT) family kinase protein